MLGLSLKANIDTTITRNSLIERFTHALTGKEEQSQEEEARRKNGKIGRRNSIAERKAHFSISLSRSILGRLT